MYHIPFINSISFVYVPTAIIHYLPTFLLFHTIQNIFHIHHVHIRYTCVAMLQHVLFLLHQSALPSPLIYLISLNLSTVAYTHPSTIISIGAFSPLHWLGLLFHFQTVQWLYTPYHISCQYY